MKRIKRAREVEVDYKQYGVRHFDPEINSKPVNRLLTILKDVDTKECLL